MALPGFFRQTKPRGFNYVPRYYDPQKEEWEQKRRARSVEHVDERSEEIPQSGREAGPEHRAWGKETEKKGEGSSEPGARGMVTEERGEQGAESGEKKPYRSKIMRGSMKNYFPRNKDRLQRQSMIRFMVIFIILAFVIYIYLRY